MRFLFLGLLPLLLNPSLAAAQAVPEPGASEIRVWTAGGYSVAGGRGNTGIWDAGLRYGWVLTGAHGRGLLRGDFEYAIDAVPVYAIFQPSGSTYGIGVNPLNLKWNFSRRGPLVPYAELSGGLLFTTNQVPASTSRVNFTPSAALGTYLGGQSLAWTIEARYLHISNAGLEPLNPGINSFEVRLGVGRFRKAK
jgi:lipid A 3-O-deacylase